MGLSLLNPWFKELECRLASQQKTKLCACGQNRTEQTETGA